MQRRWIWGLGLALVSAGSGTAVGSDNGEPIAAPPRALPNGALIAPVVGIAKESALHPPINDVPQPPTTPPAFKPDSPSILALRDADCCGSCGSCGLCGASGERNVYAGVGFYYIQPFWDNNPAAYHFTLGGTTLTEGFEHDFRHDYDPAILTWGGCTFSNGVGVRVRYWHFDQSADEQFTNNAANHRIDSAAPLGLRLTSTGNATTPETLNFDSDLTVTVVDLEATHELTCRDWRLLLAGGVRYAHLSQDYVATRVDSASAVLETLWSAQNFNGAGPTAVLEARRALGWFGLELYGSTRGSVLFGTGKQEAKLDTDVDRTASYQHDDLMPVLEVEVGMEWRGGFRYCEVFVQTSLVSQTWFGAGNASRSNSSSPTSDPFVRASIDDANLGFFGLLFTAGLKY